MRLRRGTIANIVIYLRKVLAPSLMDLVKMNKTWMIMKIR